MNDAEGSRSVNGTSTTPKGALGPMNGQRPEEANPQTHEAAPAPLGRSDVLALAALAALALVFFWKIALTNRVLAGLDVFAYFYPYRDFASVALRAGQLPLWNPHLFMGTPLLANSQAAVLYPLHWPLIWLSTPKQVAWSIVLHVWLAGAGTYLFGRLALRLRPVAAFVGAAIFALGGFLGAQVEHLNQLNASAWLPWLLLCLEGAMGQGRRRWLAVLGGGAVVGLALLAGHTQAAYIVLFGAAAYALLRGWWDPAGLRWRAALWGIGALALMVLLGVALAAGQLLPTLELSGLSVRSGGLPYNEAASFSLKPTSILKAFLPPFAWDPPFSEFVAYVGLAGLALAGAGAWAVLRQRPPATSQSATLSQGRALLVLTLLGAFLAFGAYNPVYYLLYKIVPGFDLFRAPARWLLLYGFGAAALAGIGLDALGRSRKRGTLAADAGIGAASAGTKEASGRWQVAIALLVVVELFLAGRRLAYNEPTAPAAFDSLRTAPAHLLASQATTPEAEPFRFLSLSDIGYDPGDLGELQAMYSAELPEEAVYALIVATKMKEVLAFNLPLRYRLSTVDGYDGGLLPIGRYVNLERLFLQEDEIWPDGRLRQQLRAIPPARLLSLLNVRYVITDKTQDVWIDDVFYDLEHTVPLGQVTLTDLPAFETTHLGIVSYLTESAEVPDGTPVARVTVTGTLGSEVVLTVRAGEHTAEGQYTARPANHRQARIGRPWRDNALGSDYAGLFDLGRPLQPAAISVESLLPGQRVHLRGISLVDEGSGASRSLSVDPTYRLVHSGDVKVYEHLGALPRAFVVHQARAVEDDEAALAILRDPAFDPSQEVILASGGALAAKAGQPEVEMLSYEPEEILLKARLDAPGYLVLTDTFYPGWKATVDGQPAPILRADIYFRAVPLAAGEHLVAFHYRPESVRLGLGMGLFAWLIWLVAVSILAVAIMASRTGRKTTTEV